MYKQLFFLFIAAGHITSFVWFSLQKKSAWFLLVSFYLISIPLQINFYLKSPDFYTPSGTFGNQMFIPFVFILFLLFFIYNIRGFKARELRVNIRNWVSIVVFLSVLSLMNSYNVAKFATLIFLVFFIPHILFFKLLSSLMDQEEIIKGLFTGLLVISVIHLITSLLFPLLNYVPITSFFDISGTEGATRLGTRTGAIGMFNHPNTLGVFTVVSISFFLACWLNKYFTKISLALIAMNSITLLLTFSRTSYLVFICVSFLLVYISKNPHKKLFSIENLIKFVLPVALAVGWFIFLSPFSSLFLESDVDQQVDNRTLHFTMATEAFKESPLIGVGINTHLEFFTENFFLISYLDVGEFFYENHIHNIHLIVLVEAGSMAALLWIAFLIGNIIRAKDQLALGQNQIFSLTHIGLIVVYIINGMTDWAPFSTGILPLFLFINYFSIKFRKRDFFHNKVSIEYKEKSNSVKWVKKVSEIN